MLDWSTQNIIGIGLKETVYLFKNEVKENNVVELIKTPDSFFTAVNFSIDGKQMAVGDLHGGIVVVDVNTQQIISRQKQENERISCVNWMSEHVFSTGCINGKINNLDMRTKNFVSNFSAHSDAVCGITWNKDENYLASGGSDNKVCIWDIRGLVKQRQTSSNI